MKKSMLALAALALMLCCAAQALGEIGFAEVTKENVNLRSAPGGKTIDQLDAPHSVFVFEEETVNGQLWCHVTTHRSKRNTTGWLRGDMLRFVSDEFTDVTFVQAGNHFVTGLRADGSVAILGNDMPHAPCIEAVRHWGSVTQVASWICEVFGITEGNRVLAAGRSTHMAGMHAAALGTHCPLLLDSEGRYLPDQWIIANGLVPEGIDSLRFAEIVGVELIPVVGLTKDGEVRALEADTSFDRPFDGAPYTDIDLFAPVLIARRADGRVDASRLHTRHDSSDYVPEAVQAADWTDVVAVSAGAGFTLGLRADGTVYYAGADDRLRRQIESWTDVTQLDAGNGYAIALKSDGSVVMAGRYDGYDR